ncbi:hypothetical protein BGZ76_000421 [Entomortierella beljakovae]|nr:hypothetical protein BGZ76_000421 [Entomortierella beljakovae]
MDWQNIELAILESALSKYVPKQPIKTTPLCLKHGWDPMLTDYPITNCNPNLTPSSEDVDVLMENANDKRPNACTFWDGLISSRKRKYSYDSDNPDIDITGTTNEHVRLEPRVERAYRGSFQIANQGLVPQNTVHEDNATVLIPQNWGISTHGETYFQLAAAVAASPPLPLQSPILSDPPILQDVSIPMIDISLFNQSMNLQESKSFQTVTQYIPSTPMSMDEPSHYFEERSTDDHQKDENISQPLPQCIDVIPQPVPQPYNPSESITTETTPVERQATTTTTPARSFRSPRPKSRTDQEELWYMKYKSPTRDPETEKFYCLGCNPDKVYYFETNSQLSRHATQHRFTGANRRYRCSGCKDGRRFDRMDALQRHMVQGEMYQECLLRGLYSEYDARGECVKENVHIPEHWITAAINRTKKELEKKRDHIE